MHGAFLYYGAYGLAAQAATQDSAAAKSQASQAAERVRILEANLSKVLMINEALWEILRDKLDLTDEDLNAKLYEIDMRDGVLDGKNQRSISECPSCQRKVSPRHPACIYCGQIIHDSVFYLK